MSEHVVEEGEGPSSGDDWQFKVKTRTDQNHPVIKIGIHIIHSRLETVIKLIELESEGPLFHFPRQMTESSSLHTRLNRVEKISADRKISVVEWVDNSVGDRYSLSRMNFSKPQTVPLTGVACADLECIVPSIASSENSGSCYSLAIFSLSRRRNDQHA